MELTNIFCKFAPKIYYFRYMRNYIRLLIALSMFVFVSNPTVWANTFTIVIDPGHGGGDVGTPHRKGKLDEKAIALNVALRLGKLIEKNHPDVKIVYTRKTDKYPSLPDRTQIAKKAKGDLFISIHVNACPDAKARGFETYVFGTEGSDSGKRRIEERLVEERENLDISGKKIDFDTDIDIETKILCQAQREKHNKQSLEVANAVQKALINGIKRTSYAASVNNRGVKAKNLFVLCYSPMPAILVELGYMSNQAEEKFINTEEAQNCFATALYNGFAKYKKNWDKRQLSNTSASVQETAPEPAAPEASSKPVNAEASSSAKPEPAQSASVQPNKATGAVTWKIQFLTSDKVLKDNAPELKGLKPVSYYKDGKTYKYTYGSAASTKELTADLKRVQKLFPEAFYVKFDANGNRLK